MSLSGKQNVVASETNYKVLLCWYLVPARISKYLPSHPPICFYGCTDRGTHLHLFCPSRRDHRACSFYRPTDYKAPWGILPAPTGYHYREANNRKGLKIPQATYPLSQTQSHQGNDPHQSWSYGPWQSLQIWASFATLGGPGLEGLLAPDPTFPFLLPMTPHLFLLSPPYLFAHSFLLIFVIFFPPLFLRKLWYLYS